MTAAKMALKNATLYAELQESHSELQHEMEEHNKAETENLDLQRKLMRSEKMQAIGQLAGTGH